MKLQNLTVVFIIIVLPIILLLSYYIQLQVDTIAIQTTYNTKLIESTKEALDAFEINTVEWNSEYSAVAGSKRRDIMASINTFTTSLSNNLGIGGTNQKLLLNYIPGIVYTLYDGFYIYGPGEKYEKKDTTMANPNINLEKTHILQPFVAYSETVKGIGENSGKDLTVNYTLDNYVTIYGANGEEVKSGYLIFINKMSLMNTLGEGIIYTITLKDDTKITINPETLSEKIKFKFYDAGSGTSATIEDEYNYVYTKDKTKVYYDNNTNKFFYLSNNGYAYYLNENETDPNKLVYKKMYNPTSMSPTQYQILNGNNKGIIFQDENENGILDGGEETEEDKNVLPKDYSAINFYIEANEFTTWFKANVQTFTDEATFIDHKQQVIRNSIEKNLERLSLSSADNVGTYRIPEISELDWDKILSNVSIITFMQGLPVGSKYYNNYAYATSTRNKEFVNPDEIYLVSQIEADGVNNEYYHREFCSQIKTPNNYVGYRNIDFVIKDYIIVGEETTYYYAHEDLACYNCMVERANYIISTDEDETKILRKILRKIYETALARERYVTY